MLNALQWWHWVVFGIALTLAELAIPSFFIVWFGLGALLVGLLLVVVPELSLTAQLALWTLASIAMVALWFRVFRPGLQRTRIGQSDGEIIGEAGLLVADVAPYSRGRARFQKPLLGSEEWACIADEEIAAGQRVRVVSVEGSFLKVTRA